jgi:hypothetical protein
MKKSSQAIRWEDLPEHVRKMNPHLAPGGAASVADTGFKLTPALKAAVAGVPHQSTSEKPDVKPERRLRQSQKPVMNKLEARFYEKLKADNNQCDGDGLPVAEIKIQAVRFELARGHWYKPDFLLIAPWAQRPIAYEVKGPRAFRGGFENLKTAARVHPWIKFYLVWEKTPGGEWERQEILP